MDREIKWETLEVTNIKLMIDLFFSFALISYENSIKYWFFSKCAASEILEFLYNLNDNI